METFNKEVFDKDEVENLVILEKKLVIRRKNTEKDSTNQQNILLIIGKKLFEYVLDNDNTTQIFPGKKKAKLNNISNFQLQLTKIREKRMNSHLAVSMLQGFKCAVDAPNLTYGF